jgi:hypothetical protein
MPSEALFTVAPAVGAYLRELLRYVAETVPETAELVPVLCPRGSATTTWAWHGAFARPEYTDEVYSVVHHRAEQVADWPRVQVAGVDLAANPETLLRMRGVQLLLTGVTGGEALSGQLVARRY